MSIYTWIIVVSTLVCIVSTAIGLFLKRRDKPHFMVAHVNQTAYLVPRREYIKSRRKKEFIHTPHGKLVLVPHGLWWRHDSNLIYVDRWLPKNQGGKNSQVTITLRKNEHNVVAIHATFVTDLFVPHVNNLIEREKQEELFPEEPDPKAWVKRNRRRLWREYPLDMLIPPARLATLLLLGASGMLGLATILAISIVEASFMKGKTLVKTTIVSADGSSLSVITSEKGESLMYDGDDPYVIAGEVNAAKHIDGKHNVVCITKKNGVVVCGMGNDSLITGPIVHMRNAMIATYRMRNHSQTKSRYAHEDQLLVISKEAAEKLVTGGGFKDQR